MVFNLSCPLEKLQFGAGFYRSPQHSWRCFLSVDSLSLGIIHYFSCSSSAWGRLVEMILPTSQQTSLFTRNEFQKSGLWFIPSVSSRGELSPEGTLDWNRFGISLWESVCSLLITSYPSPANPAAPHHWFALVTLFIYHLSAFLIPGIISLINIPYVPWFLFSILQKKAFSLGCRHYSSFQVHQPPYKRIFVCRIGPIGGQTSYLTNEPNFGGKGLLTEAAARWALAVSIFSFKWITTGHCD